MILLVVKILEGKMQYLTYLYLKYQRIAYVGDIFWPEHFWKIIHEEMMIKLMVQFLPYIDQCIVPILSNYKPLVYTGNSYSVNNCLRFLLEGNQYVSQSHVHALHHFIYQVKICHRFCWHVLWETAHVWYVAWHYLLSLQQTVMLAPIHPGYNDIHCGGGGWM